MTKKVFYLYIFLFAIFLSAYILFLGAYPLLDIDETRYVSMASDMFADKNYMTLILNGEFFFEKPPLFFWLEILSFKILGVSEFSARLPVVLISLLPLFLLISLSRKVKDDRFAFTAGASLLTFLEYMIITKLAILDGVFASLVSASIFFYFYTFFCIEKYKKYFWILAYLFSGLAVLAKGIPGAILPFIVVFISSIVFKTYKETFKYLWTIVFFFLAVLPWHIFMMINYGDYFFAEYIIKHHILRFLGSDIIHRNEPFYFYFLVLLWGLFPHIFVIIPKTTETFKQIFASKKFEFDYKKDDFSKFLALNFIAALSILLFFSTSKAKLITYILPVYPFIAPLCAYIWLKYIDFGSKLTDKFLYGFSFLLVFCALFSPLAGFFMDKTLYSSFFNVQLTAQIIFLIYALFGIFFLYKKDRLKLFISFLVFSSLLFGFLTVRIYQFEYTFGQNDLMKFASLAKENNLKIAAFGTGYKYSLLYYGDKREVLFLAKNEISKLYKALENQNYIVIVKNKLLKNIPLKTKIKGYKYSILEGSYVK